MLEYEITVENIEYAILNLSPENYYRGIDPSGKGDFNVCAFRAIVGREELEIYLKYGLENDGLQILIFSNHIPDFKMNQPFKNNVMEAKKVLTRENVPTVEFRETVNKEFKGLELSYEEVYYLDYKVDEETGMIDKSEKVKHYTKVQMNRNMKALKSAYMIAKGAAAPSEIVDFRTKYHIAASTLSLILGFSKNTISNIENEGVTSLASGRLIKMCLKNKDILYQYIMICDAIDNQKKNEITNRLRMQ